MRFISTVTTAALSLALHIAAAPIASNIEGTDLIGLKREATYLDLDLSGLRRDLPAPKTSTTDLSPLKRSGLELETEIIGLKRAGADSETDLAGLKRSGPESRTELIGLKRSIADSDTDLTGLKRSSADSATDLSGLKRSTLEGADTESSTTDLSGL